MMALTTRLLTLFLLACPLGCGGSGNAETDAARFDGAVATTDGGEPIDGALADGGTTDAEVAAEVPATLYQTSGGGAASSAGFKVRVNIGAPQPMGAASSASFKAHVGGN